MDLIFYTDAPASEAPDAITLTQTGLVYRGHGYSPACEAFINNYESMQDCGTLLLPLHPTLEAVCTAYLALSASESGKLPRAAGMLASYLAKADREHLPFTRDSIDTLPFLYEFLSSEITCEKDARILTDTVFTVLRQYMMDLLLFCDLDLSQQKVSARVPSVAPIISRAEKELDRYISDCAAGRELTAPLPMEDGSVSECRILLLRDPECSSPELFARLCGFSMLLLHSDGLKVLPLYCSRAAVESLLRSAGSITETGSAIIAPFDDPSRLIEMLERLECTSCSVVLQAYINASSGAVKKIPRLCRVDGLELQCSIKAADGDTCITLEGHPALEGKSFYFAMKSALELRSRLLERDIFELLGIQGRLNRRFCDITLDLPVDCMSDFFAVSISAGQGRYAVLEDGIIAISDTCPPAEQLRKSLDTLARLESAAAGGPFGALRILSKATELCRDIALSDGFLREVYASCHAPERAEAVRRTALNACALIGARRNIAAIIALSVCPALFISAFPFAVGIIAPSPGSVISAVIIAAALAWLCVFLLCRRKKNSLGSASLKDSGSDADGK